MAFPKVIDDIKTLFTNLSTEIRNRESAITTLRNDIGNIVYPVGSIYMSMNETNPSTLFGGTWEALADGRVLVAANSTYEVNSVGGASEVALTAEQLPSHSHGASCSETGGHSHDRGSMEIWGRIESAHSLKVGYAAGEGVFTTGGQHGASTAGDSGNAWNGDLNFTASRNWAGATSTVSNHAHTIIIGSTGGGLSHSNMQPYRAVYMWKRTK